MPKLTVKLASIGQTLNPHTVLTVGPVWHDDPARTGTGIINRDKTYLPDPIRQAPDIDGVAVFDIPSSADIAGLYYLDVSTGARWTNIFVPETDADFDRGLIVDDAPEFNIEFFSEGHLVKGPKGDRGIRGPQGIKGIKGDKGDKGDKGAKGDPGTLGAVDQTARDTATGARNEAEEASREALAAKQAADANMALTAANADNITTLDTRATTLEARNDYTNADQTKLAGIEDGATADQTGAEIASRIDQALGGNAWRSGGGEAEAGTRLPDYNQETEEVLHSRAGALYWDPLNEVPDTPGTATGVGHVLTVTGENDSDYAWRQPPAAGGDTSGLDARIKTNADNIAELETETATDRESIAGNERRITTNENSISALRTTDTALEAGIAENKQAIQTTNGNLTITDNNLNNAVNTIQSLVTEVDTLHPKIGRLVPINPWIRNDEAHTQLFAWFPLVAVARGAQLAVVIGGITTRIQAPEAYSATDVDGLILTVAVSASNSATITREANTQAGHVRVDLTMGDAQFHAYIPAETPPAAAPKSNVLQSAVGGSSTEGVTSVTLPTDYSSYKTLTGATWVSTDRLGQLSIEEFSFTVAVLSAQGNAVVTRETSGSSVTVLIRFDPSTRALQVSGGRIIYAELHD